MEKRYKKIGSKTDRVEPEVIKQIADGFNINEVITNTGLSKHIITTIINRNNLQISKTPIDTLKNKIKKVSKNYKTDRNKLIFDLIISGETYSSIGKKFGISKTRIQQFAKANGISRWEIKRISAKEKISAITLDINSGVGYDELMDKHNLRGNKIDSLRHYGLIDIAKTYRDTRNQTIIEEYKRKIAREVIISENKELDSPLRVKTLSWVYSISSLGGYKRYPNIGKKCMGGCQETKEVLDFILTKRNIDKLSFNKIATQLNLHKFVTIGGLPFTGHNVSAKYKTQYKKNGKRN